MEVLLQKKLKNNKMTERKIVIPGEVIVSGDDFLPGEGTKRIKK